jgi:hypothetical protein
MIAILEGWLKVPIAGIYELAQAAEMQARIARRVNSPATLLRVGDSA